jgi:hypothetical protein
MWMPSLRQIESKGAGRYGVSVRVAEPSLPLAFVKIRAPFQHRFRLFCARGVINKHKEGDARCVR